MAGLSLKNICKVYPNGFEAVKDVNAEILIITIGVNNAARFSEKEYKKNSLRS